MPRDRILVTVKTYPTLSQKYGELVCTAGIRENGAWVRLYPVPFRRLNEADRYNKYDWIETAITKSRSDHRPESYRLNDPEDMEKVGHVGTSNKWSERRRLLLRHKSVYSELKPLLEGAKANSLSLAIFKPTQIVDFVWKACDREWNQKKLDAMRNKTMQGRLFPGDEWQKTFNVIPKLPYEFSYRFVDVSGKKSEMQVLDWECGQLYWNCLKSSGGDEPTALAKVKEKYFEEFIQRDLHFFLGTIRQFHGFSPNPWVIIGLFPVPYEKQLPLL
jgi:hypothetical protein